MKRVEERIDRRQRRKRGLRVRIRGQQTRPRLTVYRSNRNIYVQLVDDLAGKTLASASTEEKAGKLDQGGNCAAAAEVGKRIAERAKQAGCERIVFDRNGYKYHGRVKALADAARAAGLKF